ncbi:MAG: UPF0280 family protein [Burkholderiales bacterium]
MNHWQPTRQSLVPGREHWRSGPIDLSITAEGEREVVAGAFVAAWERFGAVLPELVAELPQLRTSIAEAPELCGPVARRMAAAVVPFAAEFITPMAAVAGAVAEEIAAFFALPGVTRAWVNNGGDIAVFLGRGTALDIGLIPDAYAPALAGEARIEARSPVRGVATSGWRGRSFSFGIADAVTVLAATASQADAAATMIANAVDAEHPAITRAPADSLKDDTDLGQRLVVTGVGPLPSAKVHEALARGAARAQVYRQRGLIVSAALALQGEWVTIGEVALMRGTEVLPRAA